MSKSLLERSLTKKSGHEKTRAEARVSLVADEGFEPP